MSEDAEIESDSDGLGAAGGVTVTATLIHIDGGNSEVSFTGISSDSDSETTGGPAGDVNVTAKTIQLIHGGQISSTTEGSGNGGNVTVSADSFAAKSDASGIFADSDSEGSGGNAGIVHVNVNSLELSNSAEIETDTEGTGNAGDIFVNAKSVKVDGALSHDFTGISSDSDSDSIGGRAGNVSIACDNMLLRNGGEVVTDTFGTGVGGNISVTATNSLSITGHNPANFTGISVTADTGSTGPAGNVTVNADTIQMIDGGIIRSDTFGQGLGGSIAINAKSITIDRQNSGTITGVDASTEAAATGSAGNITVKTGDLSILDGGDIQADTFGKGNGGSVSVDATMLTIDPSGSEIFTGISAGADPGSTGSAGNISITGVNNIVQVVNGGQITSTTSGTGAGGNIQIAAAEFTGTGGSPNALTGVFVQSNSTDALGGNAGNLVVHADQVNLSNGAVFSTSTSGGGAAGKIQVFATQFAATGSDSFGRSGAFSQSNNSLLANAGQAGDVIIHASSLTLDDGAALSALTAGAGRGGNVSLFADSLRFSGLASMDATSTGSGRAGDLTFHVGKMDLENMAVLTRSNQTDGGNITIHAAERVSLYRSELSTSAKGDGGNITIDPLAVAINHSAILANATNGNGGNITITSDAFLSSPDSVVNASSKFGLSGNVSISSPEADVVQGVAQLGGTLAQQIGLQETCAQRFSASTFSSFVVEGSGGLSIEPGTAMPSFSLSPTTNVSQSREQEQK